MYKFSLFFLLVLLSVTQINAQWTTYNITNSNLGNDYIRDIAIDQNGDKWLVTQTNVQKFDGTNWTTFTKANGLEFNHVLNAITVRNGIVWVSTDRGINMFDGATWSNISDPAKLPVNNASNILINDIKFGPDGTLWMLGNKGLGKFDGTTWSTYTITANGTSVAGDAATAISIDNTNQKVWVSLNCAGFQGGVVSFNINSNTWNYFNVTHNCVHGLAAGANGSIFVGTCNASSLKKLENGAISNSLTIGCVPIDGMVVDPVNENTAWVLSEVFNASASLPKGLLLYNGQQVIQEFNLSNSPVPNTGLSTVAVEQVNGKRKVWVGTINLGLLSYESVINKSSEELALEKFEAYPNPNSGNSLTVIIPAYMQIIIFDSNGKKILQKRTNREEKLQLNTLVWRRGLYLIKITSANGFTRIKKFVKV